MREHATHKEKEKQKKHKPTDAAEEVAKKAAEEFTTYNTNTGCIRLQ